MPKQYSIAEAKDRLSRIVHDVEGGEPIELTRRGKAVAVMLSSRAFHRLRQVGKIRRDSWAAIQRWRQETGGVELTDDEIESWRDRSQPRDIGLPE